MPYFPFADYVTALQDEQTAIQGEWTDAQTVLNSNGAPDTVYLEIKFEGGKIVRTSDGAQVSSLPDSEKLRLNPQLNGLFKLAMHNLLLP
jgi:hypothetical protein